MEALKRIKANTVEKRLLNSRGQPNFNINFYMLNAKGEHAGVAHVWRATSNTRCAPRTAPQQIMCDALLEGKATD